MIISMNFMRHYFRRFVAFSMIIFLVQLSSSFAIVYYLSQIRDLLRKKQEGKE